MKLENIVNSIRMIAREEASMLDSNFRIFKMTSLSPTFISPDAKLNIDSRFLVLPDKEFSNEDLNRDHLLLKYNQKYIYLYRIRR